MTTLYIPVMRGTDRLQNYCLVRGAVRARCQMAVARSVVRRDAAAGPGIRANSLDIAYGRVLRGSKLMRRGRGVAADRGGSALQSRPGRGQPARNTVAEARAPRSIPRSQHELAVSLVLRPLESACCCRACGFGVICARERICVPCNPQKQSSAKRTAPCFAQQHLVSVLVQRRTGMDCRVGHCGVIWCKQWLQTHKNKILPNGRRHASGSIHKSLGRC